MTTKNNAALKMPALTSRATMQAYAILSGAVILLLFPYVRPDPSEPVSYISYFIYLIGGIGLLIFYKYLGRARQEIDCAILTEQEVQTQLLAVKAGTAQFHLYQFRDLGTKDKSLSMNRMISHVYTEAESRKFDSSLGIMAASKEEFAAHTMRVFGFQKVALQLGILGTFIGLAMAFHEIGEGDIDAHAIDSLIRSLKIPFSSSIAGLQIAFILWLHLDHLQKQHERLFRHMERCADQVINLARHALYKDSITVELQQVSYRMDEIAARVEKGNNLIERQTGSIEQGMSRLGVANKDLDTFLGSMKASQETFLQSVSNLYDSLSPKDISQELKTSLSAGAAEISTVMSSHLRETLQKYAAVEQTIVNMNKEFGSMIDAQKKYIDKLTMVAETNHIGQELISKFDRLLPPLLGLAEEIAVQNHKIDERQWRRKRLINALTFRWGHTAPRPTLKISRT